MKIYENFKICQNYEKYKNLPNNANNMPKRKFSKFVNFLKVSKTKIFLETVTFLKLSAKISKIKSIFDSFIFPETLVLQNVMQKCQKSKEFSRNYQFYKIV